MINIAIAAARSASKPILQAIDRLDTLNVSEKAHHDFVTEIDQQSEVNIIETIHKAYPKHSILAEESGEITGEDSDHVWIIDPLDGTTNFIHGFPHFSISIALQIAGRLEHAVIYDPIRQEMFTATRGKGAYVENRRMRVSNCKKLERALIGTGFPYRKPQHFKPYLQLFETLFPLTAGMRRAGSAALDLAYVAAGRLDGFFELDLKTWDIAAGILLIREAGGILSDFQGEENYLDTGNIITGNPKIFKALLQNIQPCLQES